MSESIRAMRDNVETFLSDEIICTLHLVGKSAIGREGSFAASQAHWENTGKDCGKCAYREDCALMILEE